jgi:hypothetical protein
MQVRSRPSVSPSRSRTMLSKPLAYPSTLDRRSAGCAPDVATSYVEEFWSPSLGRRMRKSQAKADA